MMAQEAELQPPAREMRMEHLTPGFSFLQQLEYLGERTSRWELSHSLSLILK